MIIKKSILEFSFFGEEMFLEKNEDAKLNDGL